MADTPPAAEHQRDPPPADGHGPSPCSARGAAARRADVGDGGRRRRHAGDHADRRTAGSAGATSADDGAGAAAERRSRARLSGPPAIARGAGDARRASRPRRRRASSRCGTTNRSLPPPPDPIAADRKRREYESLFASNVVLSRRPRTSDRTSAGARRKSMRRPGPDAASPSVDEVADAVVRATHEDRRPRGGLGPRRRPQQSPAP